MGTIARTDDARVSRPVAPARRVAFGILLTVERGRGHSDELLRSVDVAALQPVDRNLATALVMGVLRWQIALDAEIVPLFSRPNERPPTEVLLALRMGAFQLRHMDRIPVHAAVNESVELCREAGQPQAAAMVNAILRRLAGAAVEAASRSSGAGARGVPIFETTAAFAQRLGHPAWLAERWVATYGREAAVLICEAGQHEPGYGGLFGERDGSREAARAARRGAVGAAGIGVDVDAIDLGGASDLPVELGTGEADPEQMEQAGGAPVGSLGGWDAEDAETVARPAAAEGWAMDDGSRLVAEIAAAAMPGARRVWDCCAAPGGKTRVLLDRLPEAEVLATDVSARRLRAMEDRFRETGLRAHRLRTAPVAAEALAADEGLFDLVLCDVPCSGTGTLARNPEIRHRLRPEELVRQAERQGAMVRAALGRVAPGGRLVYATCSLEPEECEAVVESVAAGWQRVSVRMLLDALVRGGRLRGGVDWESVVRDSVVWGDALRTLPGVHPCDGFFAVVLERN